MPQGSTGGPMLFNLFTNDLVLFLSETFLSIYADDNNLFSIGKELNIVKEKLRKDFKVVTDWFFENLWAYIQQNATTCVLVKASKMIHLTLEIYLLKIVKKK